jgi:hypothetical protein
VFSLLTIITIINAVRAKGQSLQDTSKGRNVHLREQDGNDFPICIASEEPNREDSLIGKSYCNNTV